MSDSRPEILAIIPARGGSKGIPDKNIALLAGRPLLAYTADAVLNSRMITRAVLSSDSECIIDVGLKCGLDAPFVRPSELAGDETPALSVVRHAVDWLKTHDNYDPDYIVLLQPTSPLRTALHVDAALGKFVGSGADSIVSVVKVPHNCSPYSVMIPEMVDGKLVLKPFMHYDERKNLRQQKPVVYARNGAAIYAFTRKCLLDKGSMYGDCILGYEMDKFESIDVDCLWDMELCEYILKRKNKN